MELIILILIFTGGISSFEKIGIIWIHISQSGQKHIQIYRKGHAIAESGKTFYQFTHPSKFDKVRSHFIDNWVGYVIGGIFGVIVTLIASYIILKIEYVYFQ